MKTLPSSLNIEKNKQTGSCPTLLLNIKYNSLDHYYGGHNYTFDSKTINGSIINYNGILEQLDSQNEELEIKIVNSTLKSDILTYEPITCELYFGISPVSLSDMIILFVGELDIFTVSDLNPEIALTFIIDTKNRILGTPISATHIGTSNATDNNIVPIVYGNCKRVKAIPLKYPPNTTLSLSSLRTSDHFVLTDGRPFTQNTNLDFIIGGRERVRGKIVGNLLNLTHRELILNSGYTLGTQPTSNCVKISSYVPGSFFIGLNIKFIFSPTEYKIATITNFTLPNVIGFDSPLDINSNTNYEIYGRALGYEIGTSVVQLYDEYCYAIYDGTDAVIEKVEMSTSLMYQKDEPLSPKVKPIHTYAILDIDYYTINYNDSRFTTHPITTLSMKFDPKLTPHSPYDTGDIFVSFKASVNPIACVKDILLKLGFTNANIDLTSYNNVLSLFSWDKISYAITSKSDISVIYDIATQHDFSISFINGKFYFSDNLSNSSPITITSSDISENSYNKTTPSINDIINKIIVKFVNKFGFDDEFFVIDSISIAKYGIREKILNLSTVDCAYNHNIARYLAYRHLYKNSQKFYNISFNTFLQTLQIQPNDIILYDNIKSNILYVNTDAEEYTRNFKAKALSFPGCSQSCEAYHETSCLTYNQIACQTGSETSCNYLCESTNQNICSLSCISFCELECVTFLKLYGGGSDTCIASSCQADSCQSSCRSINETGCYGCETTCVVACRVSYQQDICTYSNELCMTSCVFSCRSTCVISIESATSPCQTTCQGSLTSCFTTSQTGTSFCEQYCQLTNEAIEQNCTLYCQTLTQLYSGTTCLNYCQSLSCQLANTTGCSFQCETSNMNSCSLCIEMLGSCSTACETYCTIGGGCQTGCTANLTVNNTKQCTSVKELGCSFFCELNCTSCCRADGLETGVWICTTQCQGTSCVQYCMATTQGGDFGSGGGSNPCITTCIAYCMTAATTGCGEYCTVGCQCFCEGVCQSSCRDTSCMTDCQCLCQTAEMSACTESTQGACYSNCQGFCMTGDTTSACVLSCQAWTMTSDFDGCQFYCTLGIQCSCFANCQSSCRDTCQTTIQDCFLGCKTSCQVPVQLGVCTSSCQQSTQPCNTVCEIACQTSCTGGNEICATSCQGVCQSTSQSCINLCETACQGSCTGYTCQTSCQLGNIVHCTCATTNTVFDCNSMCETICQTTCTLQAQISCKVYNMMTSCYTNCQEQCTTLCKSYCQTSTTTGACRLACTSFAMTSADNYDGCQFYCTLGLQCSCFANCQSSCRENCMTVKQATCVDCQVSCQLPIELHVCISTCQTVAQNYCNTGCEIACMSSCTSGTQACAILCQGACRLGSQSCSFLCETACQSRCTGYSCQTNCQQGNIVRCSCATTNTIFDCASTCQIVCQLSCTGFSQGGCFGYNELANCATSCRDTCTTLCKSYCQTSATTGACRLACTSFAMTSADNYDGCQFYCTIGIQCTCFANCQAACRNDCMTSKQADCVNSCMTSCESPDQLGCRTYCQTDIQVCSSACELNCQSSCTGGQELCATSCQGTCKSSYQACISLCETTCTLTCTGYECQTACTISTVSKCKCATSNTVSDCQSDCQIYCRIACTLFTQGGCFGYNEIDNCATACRASCTTQCRDVCQTRDTVSTCAISCRSFCMTGGCTTECQAYCTVGAQCSCFADCQSACRDTCQINCRCTCKTSAQT